MNAPAQTTVSELRKGMTSRDIAALPREKQFPEMLNAFKKEIALALPKHLNPDRMARIALTCFRMNPKLAQCKPQSVFAAVIQAAQLGLEPGLMGQAYLIPYKDECQLIPGYQGLLDLVRRSGHVVSIDAHVVYSNDAFKLSFGLTPVLEHSPALDIDCGERRLVYAVAKLKDGGVHVEVMTRREVEAIRDRSQNVINAKRYGKKTPWDTDTDEMWRKTVLRRIAKFLPKSPELALAIAMDTRAAMNAPQGIDLSDAISGEYVTIDPDHADEDEGKPNTESKAQTAPTEAEQAVPESDTQAIPETPRTRRARGPALDLE